jgi:hypothetical protein
MQGLGTWQFGSGRQVIATLGCGWPRCIGRLSFHVHAKQQRLITWEAGGLALVVADIARQLASDQLNGFEDSVPHSHHRRSLLSPPLFEVMEAAAFISTEGECDTDIMEGDCASWLHLATEANALNFRGCSVAQPRGSVAL